MRIAIFGVGAVGSVLAARFALAGIPATVIARGAHLNAMRQSGLRFTAAGADVTVAVEAFDDAAQIEPCDLVIATVKAHALNACVPAIAGMLKPTGRLLSVANGIPWWFLHGRAVPDHHTRLRALDPQDALWSRIGARRVLGCAFYARAELPAPGHVHWFGGDRVVVGEPDGSTSADLAFATDVLTRAGWQVKATGAIRDAIWDKLQGNAAFNPLNVIVGGTMATLTRDEDIARLALAAMSEIEAVGHAMGASFSMTVAQRLAATKGFGDFKTSMLQDFERGRLLELDAILAAPVELGEMGSVATPTLRTLLALARAKLRHRAA